MRSENESLNKVLFEKTRENDTLHERVEVLEKNGDKLILIEGKMEELAAENQNLG